MNKIISIFAIVTMFFTGAATSKITEQFQMPNIPEIRLAYNADSKWEDEVYTYTESSGIYSITLKSETEYTMIYTPSDSSDEPVSFNGTYTKVDGELTLSLFDTASLKFVINEDGTLTKSSVIYGENEYTGKSISELVTLLINELKQSTINWDNISKILLTIAGALSSVIIALLVALIRLRVKNINKDEVYELAKKKSDELYANVCDKIQALDTKVTKKIDDTEAKRKAEAEEQSLKLKQSIEEAKANLSINDVLNEE